MSIFVLMNRIVAVLFLLFILSCSKEDRNEDQCNAKNPFEMEWMSEWIADLQNCSCTISIIQANYDGEPVFWQLMTDPLCQGLIEKITVYSCIGDELLVLEHYNDLMEFQQKVTDFKIIYNCPTPHN